MRQFRSRPDARHRSGVRSRRTLAGLSTLAIVAASSSVAVTAGAAPLAHQASRAASSSGKTYIWAVGEDFTSLDTSSIQSMGNAYSDGVRNSALLQYDLPTTGSASSCTTLANPPALEPTHLVKSWSTSKNGKEIFFTLNQGIKSQDGNTLTSADVAWSIKREDAIDPVGQLLMYVLGGFDKSDPITITGPYTFHLNVSTPTDVTDLELTEIWQEVYDMKTVMAHATKSDPWGQRWLADHVADFGPWELSSFSPGQQVTYVPNPNYTGPRGNVTKLVVETITDASTRQQLLEKAGAQAADALSYDQYASLKSRSNVGVEECPSAYRDFLGLDTNAPQLSQPIVRQAISLALDRKQLVQAAYRGYAKPATSGVSSVFDPTAGTSNFAYDVTKAKQLLSKAGFPSGFDLSLAIAPSSTGAYVTTLAEFIQSQLAQVGITVSIQTVPTASEFKADLAKGAYESFIDTESPDFSDPGYAYELTNGCSGLQNFTSWCNKADDKLAIGIESLRPGPSRTKLINQLSANINTQMPVVYLSEVPSISARATCVSGIPSAFPVYNDYVYLAKDSC